MTRGIAASLLLAMPLMPIATTNAQTGGELALELRSNVVAIETRWPNGSRKDGFGFVVAQSDNTTYVVTARHLLIDRPEKKQEPRINVRIYDYPGYTFIGESLDLRLFDIDLDVVVLSAPRNANWQWSVLASDYPRREDPVWFIGRDGEWYVPPAAGAYIGYERIVWEIRVGDLPVRVGTSGAPLLSADGIIGMIIRSDASVREAIALSMEAVQLAFEQWRLPWALAERQRVKKPTDELTAFTNTTPSARDPSAIEADLHLDRQDRRAVQSALHELGFDPGVPDGIFGPKTRLAIRRFQLRRSEMPTGFLTHEQAIELLAIGHQVQ